MQNFVIENVFRKLYGTLIGKKIRLLGFLISKMSIIHNNQLTIRLPPYSCLQEITLGIHISYIASKPSLKIGTAYAICWNALGLFRDYSLNNIFLGVKLFCFSR